MIDAPFSPRLGLVFLVSGFVTWFYTETIEVGLVRVLENTLLRLRLLIGFLSFRFAEEEKRREVEAGKQKP